MFKSSSNQAHFRSVSRLIDQATLLAERHPRSGTEVFALGHWCRDPSARDFGLEDLRYKVGNVNLRELQGAPGGGIHEVEFLIAQPDLVSMVLVALKAVKGDS